MGTGVNVIYKQDNRPKMKSLMLNPTSPNQDFWLYQKWNLKPVNRESPDQHQSGNLPERP